MRAWKLLGGVLAMLLVVGAPAGAAPITFRTAQQQYLSDVAPLDRAAVRLHALLSSQNVTSWAVLRTLAVPYTRELRTFDAKIQRQPWPNNVRPDIVALVRADEALASLLSKFRGTSAQLDARTRLVNQAAGLVRRDLKLPPVGNGSNG